MHFKIDKGEETGKWKTGKKNTSRETDFFFLPKLEMLGFLIFTLSTHMQKVPISTCTYDFRNP